MAWNLYQRFNVCHLEGARKLLIVVNTFLKTLGGTDTAFRPGNNVMMDNIQCQDSVNCPVNPNPISTGRLPTPNPITFTTAAEEVQLHKCV